MATKILLVYHRGLERPIGKKSFGDVNRIPITTSLTHFFRNSSIFASVILYLSPIPLLHTDLEIAPRPRPSLVSLLFAALPVTQHVAVITFFVAVFYALLVGHAAATEVGTCCAVAALLGFGIRKWGWGSDQLDDRRSRSFRSGAMCLPAHR